jgi:MFS family permease
MSLGTFIVPAGRLGDMFGHKKIFVLGFLWLALFSFLCGFAYNWGYVALCVCRGFQGIGPALLVPNGIALIARAFPPGDKRAFVIGVFGACGPCGFLTGAAFAGMFAEVAWWPWAFWSTAVACLFITGLSYMIIPEQLAVAAAPPGQQVPTFDWAGCLTGVTGLLLINFALNQAPLAGWGTPYVYFLLIIGIMFTVIFFIVEMYLVKDPLLPVRGLQPQALLTLGCIAAGWASHGIWLYYYFMFQMHQRHLSGTHATLELIWVGPLGIIFALSTGLLIKRFHVSRVMFAAMVFFLTGSLLLTYAPVGQTYWAQTFLSVLITPGGMNLSFPAGCLLLSNAMPREHQGKAASLVSTVVNYSIASGLGFAGSIESSIAHKGGSQLRGYRGAWELGIGFSALGVVLSLYFIWTARDQIREARSKRPGAPANDAVDALGQKKFFRMSTVNLHRPALPWLHRVTSQVWRSKG